ncbi:hypothetical protein [Arcobacter aquimarinus]|uniref:hypothetical protein n=1 Tax=Arcobacter aquimarinus TaxID=1315211 RepID=UPI003BB11C68
MNGSIIADEFLAEEIGVDYDEHTTDSNLLTKEDVLISEEMKSVENLFLVLGMDFNYLIDREVKLYLLTHSKEFHLNYLKIRKKRKYKKNN